MAMGWESNSFVTVIVTVTDTKPPVTTEIFPEPAPSSTPSRNQTGGINIRGSVVAGIGAGASVGLFGIGIAVVLFCTQGSRRRKG